MQRKFDIFDDPGHGWLKVPVSLLEKLGIADKITPYSYRRGDFAYLEEDCDAGTFIVAYKEATGNCPKYRHHIADKSSKIRSYWSYGADRFA